MTSTYGQIGAAAGLTIAVAAVIAASPAMASAAPATPAVAASSALAPTPQNTTDQSITVSPLHIGRVGTTTLTVSGGNCPAAAGQTAIVTVATDVAPRPSVTTAPDTAGDWSAHLTVAAAPNSTGFSVVASCAGASSFDYTPVTVDYLPFVVGDGIDRHTVAIIGSDSVVSGGSLHLRSTLWQPNQHVEVTVDASEQAVATVTANTGGVIDATIRIGTSTQPGKHTVHLRAERSIVTASQEIDIVDLADATFIVSPAPNDHPQIGLLANTGVTTRQLLAVASLLLFVGAILIATTRRECLNPRGRS